MALAHKAVKKAFALAYPSSVPPFHFLLWAQWRFACFALACALARVWTTAPPLRCVCFGIVSQDVPGGDLVVHAIELHMGCLKPRHRIRNGSSCPDGASAVTASKQGYALVPSNTQRNALVLCSANSRRRRAGTPGRGRWAMHVLCPQDCLLAVQSKDM